MKATAKTHDTHSVALRTEGVDRNEKGVEDGLFSHSRPPYGGRG